jgi:DNA transposition AAA+ family ATPase
MHTNTHPEVEERIPVRTAGEESPSSLRDQLLRVVEADGLTLRQVATAIGYSHAVVSQYLNGDKYPGDRQRLEKRVADWLRSRERRRLHPTKLIPSDATDCVKSALETIRRTGDVGVIFGDAGVGKSSGIVLYLDDNPTGLCINLTRWNRTAEAVERLVFHAIEHGAWKKNTSRGDFVVEKLRGSGRLLVVDNAHKATPAAIEWLFDLHDETGIPIALVGNEEVLRPIEANDQRFSRVGLKQPVPPGRLRPMVKHLVAQVAPALSGQVEHLLEQVADHHGRFRSVTKTASLAAMLSEAGHLAPVDAVKAAHLRLVRHYALD